MSKALSLKKIFKWLISNSKGFSSVIGTTFMVLVVMLLSSSVFLWTLSQNTLYNEAVRDKNQLEVDLLNERVRATGGSYTVYGDGNVLVSTQVRNLGPLAVEIVNLWLMNVNTERYNFTESLNINLQPGENSALAINVTLVGSTAEHTFTSWFVTRRGNVVPIEAASVDEEEAVTWAKLAEGIGSIVFNFSTFRYYTYSGNKLENYPEGNPTFRIPYGETIAFGFMLTNQNPYQEAITFDEETLMWSYFPACPGHENGPFWHIANVNPDGSINATYTPITLEWGESKLIVFAKQSGGWKVQQRNSLGAINLLIYGTFESGMEYAQNIPFVSVYAYD